MACRWPRSGIEERLKGGHVIDGSSPNEKPGISFPLSLGTANSVMEQSSAAAIFDKARSKATLRCFSASTCLHDGLQELPRVTSSPGIYFVTVTTHRITDNSSHRAPSLFVMERTPACGPHWRPEKSIRSHLAVTIRRRRRDFRPTASGTRKR